MSVRVLVGGCRARLAELESGSVHTCVTSPPYFGLRDYGVDGQIGLELTPDEFVAKLVGVFREVRRVLRDDGTLWLNLGDSYASNAGGYSETGSRGATSLSTLSTGTIGAVQKGRGRKPFDGFKPKDLIGIPWMVAFALRADGWYLRQDIIWSKPNPMPESVRDRCTKAHEYLFLLSKSERYYYDAASIAEAAVYADSGRSSAKPEDLSANRKRADRVVGASFRAITEKRNRRSVWTVATQPFKEAHFATYPPELVEPRILAGAPVGGVVLDPFFGAGTTGLVADRLRRDCIGIELNPEYARIAEARLRGDAGMFAGVEVAA